MVTGEAEEIWPSVLSDFENGSLKRLYEGGLADIKNLPLPRRDLLRPGYFWGTLQTSRGCPLSCNFCSVLDSKNRIVNKNYPSAWDDYRFTRMLFKPHNLSVKDVYEGFAWIKLNFYSWPVKIRRYLRTLFDTKDIVTAYFAYRLNKAYEVAFRTSEIFDDSNLDYLNEKFGGCKIRYSDYEEKS